MTARLCEMCGSQHERAQPCGLEPDRSGELVDRYRLIRRLGSGGMGVVYEARHRELERRFALKFLRAELARREKTRLRFTREARAAGAVEHENVAATIDLGEATDGTPYIVMEYLEGEDLGRLLERTGPLSVPRAVSIVIQACRGLSVAHARKILHRDLKPANLFVSKRGDGTDHVRVLDFGIAKVASSELDETGSVTGDGQVLGTPAYMPPEQARGLSSLDQSVDVYALGAILYELLSGHKAHPGATRNEVLYHVLTQPIVPLRELCSELPEGLVVSVTRALSPLAAERFGDVAAFSAKLRPYALPQVLVDRHEDADAPRDVTTTEDSHSTLGASAEIPLSVRPRRAVNARSALAFTAVSCALLASGYALQRERASRALMPVLRSGTWPAALLEPIRLRTASPAELPAPLDPVKIAEAANKRPLSLMRVARVRRSAVREPATRESQRAGDEMPSGSLSADIYKP